MVRRRFGKALKDEADNGSERALEQGFAKIKHRKLVVYKILHLKH
jgi:hypothetical protein